MIKTHQEPYAFLNIIAENCIFCGAGTRMWHAESNNPVCGICSNKYDPSDISIKTYDVDTRGSVELTNVFIEAEHYLYCENRQLVIANGSGGVFRTFLESNRLYPIKKENDKSYSLHVLANQMTTRVLKIDLGKYNKIIDKSKLHEFKS